MTECDICGAELEWTECYNGCDEGYFDEHNYDPVNYAPREAFTKCEVCKGEGGYLQCPFIDDKKHQDYIMKKQRDNSKGE